MSLYRKLWIYDLEDKIEYPSKKYVNDIILKYKDTRSEIINLLIDKVPDHQINTVGLAISIFDLYSSKTSYFDSLPEVDNVTIFACFHLAAYVTCDDNDNVLEHLCISSHIMDARIDDIFTVICGVLIRPFIFIQNPIDNVDKISFDEYQIYSDEKEIKKYEKEKEKEKEIKENQERVKNILKIAITERHKLALISYHIPELIRCKPSHIVHAILLMTRPLFTESNLDKSTPDESIYWICLLIIKELNNRSIPHKYNYIIKDNERSGEIIDKIFQRPLIMNIDPTGLRFNKKNYIKQGNIKYIVVSNNKVAIKKIYNVYISKYLETSILLHLSSPYIISLYGSEIRSHKTYLYLPLGKYDLNTMVYLHELPIEKIRIYMYQMIKGLHHIHENDIIHRDIKPENIVYFADEDLMKIVDFGISVPFSHYNTVFSDYIVAPNGDEYNFIYNNKTVDLNMACTSNYRAPEALLYMNYDYKIDVWAIGATFYFMVTGKLFVKNGEFSNDELLYLICTKLGVPNEKVWPGVTSAPGWNTFKTNINANPIKSINFNQIDHIDIISLCLIFNPEYRADTAQLLELYQ